MFPRAEIGAACAVLSAPRRHSYFRRGKGPMMIPRWCAAAALLWLLDPSAAQAQCSYSVTPATFAVGSTASSRTLSVITGTQCSWTAASTVSWISIASASGSGIGSVTFLVQQNPTAAARSGTVIVAGQTISVTQDAGSCSSTVTPTTFSIGPEGGSRTLSVISGTQCPWSAASTVTWMTVTDGASGSGIGAVTFTVAANASGATRMGTLTVAGQTVTVTQGSSSSGGTALPPPQNVRILSK